MSNIAKLKKQAAEFEQKKQFDRALSKYIQIIQALDGAVDEADVALYNRVGDLLLKQGNISQAVDYYERAVDLYTEGGFFNNAIALCNKILRNAPGRNSVYYKLGKISAQKGFVNDAKQNFLEYADRMQSAGQLEEAFRALKEFADLCPDQDDIRLMLADQLVRKNRKNEAIEQLQTLYDKFKSEGRTQEARATVDRIKAIDPEVEPRASTAVPTPKATDLIFLHVDYDAPPSNARGVRTSVPIFPPVEDDEPRGGKRRGPASDLPLIMPDYPDEEETPTAAATPAGLEHTSLTDEATADADVAPVDGLETIGGATEEVDLGDLGVSADVSLGDLPSLDMPDDELPDETESELDLALTYPEEIDQSGSQVGERDVDLAESPLDSLGGYGELSTLDIVVPEPELDLPDAGLVVPDMPSLPMTASPDDDLSFDIAREQSQFLDAHETEGTSALDDDIQESVVSGAIDDAFGADTLDEPSITTGSSGGIGAFGDDIEAALDAALEGGNDFDAFLPGKERDVTHAPVPEETPVERMRRQLEIEPDNWALRRSYAEAMLESGDRNGGLRELDSVMIGFERWSDFVAARTVAEEILRVDPNSVKHHQKRVEYAFRASDKPGLVDAYLELADCLFRGGQLEKSRAVYQRVLELAPQDLRAQEALRAYGKSERTPPSLEMPKYGAPGDADRAGSVAKETAPAAKSGGGFVNLADLLRDDDSRSTRMVVDVKEPSTGEQVDFAEMLHMFKQGVAANVDEGDHQSHYDLGVAYKEMGLLDEAISEFQKALRGTEQRVRTYEALGQCFVEKRQFQIAITILSRALNDKRYTDDMLVGVLYLLGTAAEQLERWPDALAYYQRVFAIDIEFRDVKSRLASVEQQLR
ncbi:MAG TPA: tetratricopeptide repeat protein [Gemmatimonadaceae bacterium]|nr:tetratricopeptide repeat protein [Gemmatimonadaceae bacterium]